MIGNNLDPGRYALPDPDAPRGYAVWVRDTDPLGRPRFGTTPTNPDPKERAAAAAVSMIAANPILARAIYIRGEGRCTYCATRLVTSAARHRGTCAPCGRTQTGTTLAALADAVAKVAATQRPRDTWRVLDRPVRPYPREVG